MPCQNNHPPNICSLIIPRIFKKINGKLRDFQRKAVDFGENFQAFSHSYEENNKVLEKMHSGGINELSGWLYTLIPEEGDEQ